MSELLSLVVRCRMDCLWVCLISEVSRQLSLALTMGELTHWWSTYIYNYTTYELSSGLHHVCLMTRLDVGGGGGTSSAR